MSVNDRLGRLLFIVPYVSARDGVPLVELAQKLGVTPRQIEADLELLAMVGQPPLTPDHLIDMYIEDDVVYVDLHQSLSRPLRLTHEEASALVLAAKLVSELGGLGHALEVVVQKLVDNLNPVDREMLQSLSERVRLAPVEALAMAPAVLLRLAVEHSECVTLEYYSASSDRQKRYQVKPLALLMHGGMEYLVALDVEAQDQEKLFRLDRLGRVEHTGITFVPPQAFDLEKFRTRNLYFGRDGFTAQVRFAEGRSTQIRERFDARDIEVESGGALRVRLSTSSPAWLSRWVLFYGEDAEVVGPEHQREYVGRVCAEAAAVYACPAPGLSPALSPALSPTSDAAKAG